MKNKKLYCVYVLWSTLGRCHYIGLSDDVEHRLEQHNTGESRWTKRWSGSWTLVWQREFETLSAARKFEKLLKRQKGGLGFYKLTGLNRSDYSD